MDAAVAFCNFLHHDGSNPRIPPMSTAIKVSETLAEEARAAAIDADRSLTGQLEHWARLGKAVEPLFNSAMVSVLKRCGGDLSKIDEEAEKAKVLEVFERFRQLPSEDLRKEIGLDQIDLYEADPDRPGGLIRIKPDGTREHGKRVGLEFVRD
jgi:hypothetical protein